MEEMAGILVFCLAVVAMAAGLLNWPERPKDPEEDLAQELYLTEWNRKHGKYRRQVQKHKRSVTNRI